MKKVISVALCVGLISTMAFAKGGWGNKNSNSQSTSGTTYLNQVVDSTPISALSQAQKEDLLFMYEEEKMARDVYITLGNKWNARVFENISSAEQRHMDSIKSLLLKYSLEVPVLSSVGMFENSHIQDLYNQLVSEGEDSLEDAYQVGVKVEETDINDLENKISNTPSDIESVYKSLLSGSYKHLDAFNRMLDGDTSSYGGYGRQR